MKKRGSEWRKWDLHIHTPASFYWNGSKPFAKMDASEKEAEIKTFIQHINDSEVSVFCLMDYWTFDWYIELKKYTSKFPNELRKTVFPGMELRIESPTSYRLNVHAILSDKLTEQELIDFKSELYVASIDKKLSNDAIIQFAKTLDESKAKKHSFDNPANLSEDKLLQLGSITIEVTKESLKKAFNQIPENTGYILMPYDTSDGLLKLNWEKHPHADNYFMQSSHIFESRDQINIDLINGIRTVDNDKFFDNFSKTIGKPKPCVAGSDAHKYADYGKYPSEKATWIKAEPTFEGFRQIIFEPRQRAKIQSSKPDYKDDRLIIDKVRFFSSDSKFTDQEIHLNENLNVIIGGKSSGKSILVYLIAKTLLADQNFFKKAEIEDKYLFRNEDPNFNFEITTKGGFSQMLYRAENENSMIPEIKYIPQNYLIKLAEPERTKKSDALNTIVRELINEDPESQVLYDNFITKLKLNDRKRENAIDAYFELADRISTLETQLKTKSTTDVLQKNISVNTARVQELSKQAGLTPEQIEEFNLLQKELEDIKNKRAAATSDFTKVKDHVTELMNSLETMKSRKNMVSNSLETKEFKDLMLEISSIIETASSSLETIRNKFTLILTEEGKSSFSTKSEISNLFQKNTTKRKAIEEKLVPFLKNQALKKEIDEINKSISADNVALQAIAILTKEIQQTKTALAQQKRQIFDLYNENYDEYVNVLAQLKGRTADLQKDGLKIEGLVKFNVSKFQKMVYEFSDGRRSSYRDYDLCSEDKSVMEEVDLKLIRSDLEKMFTSIAETGTYSLTSKFDKKSAIKKLLDDYFFDYWQIEYKNDKLGTMSTGKASFVILMLIVGLSKSKAPILIDQPEDNLDNRSITTELVEYLREKKIERQIILVTHNPNIVVNADAENVIIAHQSGQSEQKSTSPFLFDYINGAIENSFPVLLNETDLLKSMGIREHIADIVEGGEDAFKSREAKYGFSKW